MVDMLELRLLELEQKFESYRAIHQQELNEIKTTLIQLHEDILRNEFNRTSDSQSKNPAVLPTPSTNNRKLLKKGIKHDQPVS